MEEIAAIEFYAHENPAFRIRIATDSRSDELIGFCGVGVRDFEGHREAAYISAIGVHKDYRRCRLPDGTRVGDFLLADAVAQIEALWDVLPLIWAMVSPGNAPCHALFDRAGFDRLDATEQTDRVFRLRLPERAAV